MAKSLWTPSEYADAIRESTKQTIREAGLSSESSDGSERGAAQSSGKYPPNTTEETGGQTRTPNDPGNSGDGSAATGEMRGAPQSKGVGEFSTGGPAPTDTGDTSSSGSEHVSDGSSNRPNLPGPSEHVSESSGVRLLEAAGITYPGFPCATCSHFKGWHNVGSSSGTGQCFYCAPKGSIHKFSEAIDFSAHVITVPLAAGNPQDPGDVYLGTPRNALDAQLKPMTESRAFVGNTREAHNRLFTADEQALIRLEIIREAIYPQNSKGGDPDKDSARDRADVYNAHSAAAHRQSLSAYTNGGGSSSAAQHVVAADHHELAAKAATAASNDYPDDHQAKKDYKTASRYHGAQADTHRMAAKIAQKGQMPSRYEMAGPSMY